jgi:hypothetical protein
VASLVAYELASAGEWWQVTGGKSEVAHLLVMSRDMKMLREALCAAQNALLHTTSSLAPSQAEHLGELVQEIDIHRPLGSNGKHGTLHTPTCGCEDK